MDLILHVLVINWLSILNRIWFSHSLLNSVCFLEEATFSSLSRQKPFIMPLTSVWTRELILRQSETEYIDWRVRSRIGHQILGQVINRVENITDFRLKYGKGFGKRSAHHHPIFVGLPPRVGGGAISSVYSRWFRLLWTNTKLLKNTRARGKLCRQPAVILLCVTWQQLARRLTRSTFEG